jgi:hypothetical protein
MNKKKISEFNFLSFVIITLVILLLNCTNNNIVSTQIIPELSYKISFINLDSLHIEVKVTSNNLNGIDRILFPPFDADNPELVLKGNNIHNLKISGARLLDTLNFCLHAKDSIQAITVIVNNPTYTIEYDITFPYLPSLCMRSLLPGALSSSGWYCQGNYIFCIPDYCESKTSFWRKNINAFIEFIPLDDKKIYGIPSYQFKVNTVYELLFIQIAISDDVFSCRQNLVNIVNLSANSYENSFANILCEDITKLNNIFQNVFKGINFPFTIILQDSGSGMEGTYSFYMQNWTSMQYLNSFRSVTAHEALHLWIGIRTGDFEDPWWKEATAAYLGFLLGTNIGFPKDSVRKELIRDISKNSIVQSKALSDPNVREFLFDPDTNKNAILLVYVKGAQVNMILDQILRKATNNTITLLSKTGELCREFEHKAFTREELKSFLEKNTNLDLSEFFYKYIDSPGSLDTSFLAEVYDFLVSAGAFENIIY